MASIGLATPALGRDRNMASCALMPAVTRRAVLSVLGAVPAMAATARPSRAQRFPDGLLVQEHDDLLEVGTFAELRGNGRLHMAFGSFEDIPAVARVRMVVCNLGQFELGAVWVTSRAIFDNEHAERRQLAYVINRVSIRTTRNRVAALEGSASIGRLLTAVGAGAGNPGYAVFTVANGPVTRNYLVELRLGDSDLAADA